MSVRLSPSVDAEEPPGAVGVPTNLEGILDASILNRPRSRGRSFRNRFFPGASPIDWDDWRWQLRNRVRSRDILERILDLSVDERAAFDVTGGGVPFSVTPYYLSLLEGTYPGDPLRKTVIPSPREGVISPEEEGDPLHEERDSPVPGLVHRYPDRVLFLLTYFCSTYCRYCTRSRRVGDQTERTDRAALDRRAAIDYIRRHREIRDVLLSGGDPLTLSDEFLDSVLAEIRAIPHVEIVRIGTKVPAVLPMRITPALVRILRRYHPLFISIHATHPREVTPAMVRACTRLADGGIPLGSQTVLLNGVNDSVAVMTDLNHRLLAARVRPYYLYQCDPIRGSSHFRTPVRRGIEIIEGMRGFTSGYAVPTYVIDAPGGGGKIPLLPNYVEGYDGEQLVLRNYEGNRFVYPDTESTR